MGSGEETRHGFISAQIWREDSRNTEKRPGPAIATFLVRAMVTLCQFASAGLGSSGPLCRCLWFGPVEGDLNKQAAYIHKRSRDRYQGFPQQSHTFYYPPPTSLFGDNDVVL